MERAQLTHIALDFIDVARDAGGAILISDASATVGATGGYTPAEVNAALALALDRQLVQADSATDLIHTRWSRHR